MYVILWRIPKFNHCSSHPPTGAETAIASGRGQHPTEDANLCSSFDFQNRQEPYFIDRTKETCVPQNQTVD